AKLLVKIETETPVAPQALRPALDARLDAICLKALARRPGQRFASMAEFASALAAFGAQTGNLAVPHLATTRHMHWSARRRWLWVAAACLAVVLLAGGIYLATRSEKSEPSAKPSDAELKKDDKKAIDAAEAVSPEDQAKAWALVRQAEQAFEPLDTDLMI